VTLIPRRLASKVRAKPKFPDDASIILETPSFLTFSIMYSADLSLTLLLIALKNSSLAQTSPKDLSFTRGVGQISFASSSVLV